MVGQSKTQCAGCTTTFTFLNGRHLCRSCGEYFCHSCSSGKRKVSGHSEAVRVCDLCLHSEDRRAGIIGDKTGPDLSQLASYDSMDASEQKRLEVEYQTMNSLKRIYKAKVSVLEQNYSFVHYSGLSELTEADFDQRPMVLLIGQYSVGKTSFIRYLMDNVDVPAMRIGPEPTTDRFLCVHSARKGTSTRVIPGNAAAVDVERPYTSLSRFGVSFLSRFEVAEVEGAPILDKLVLVDSPGILAGKKQSVDVRGYDFNAVLEWFASRADRILLIFDSSKLDIPDELKATIHCLKGFDEKMRIVLNKADLVAPQTLLRVVGALYYNLGRILETPEVIRVYIGSFWDKPYDSVSEANHSLFELERSELMNELNSLPRESAVRRINELVKRIRMVRTHVLLINSLRNGLPMFNALKAEKKFLSPHRLRDEMAKVQQSHNIAVGDLPDIETFQAGLRTKPISTFSASSKRQLDVLEGALSRDIPKLLYALH